LQRDRIVVSLVGRWCSFKRKSDGSSLDALIVGETANTVIVKTKSGLRVMPKSEYIFSVRVNGGVMIADGGNLRGRPSQRLKRVKRSWQRP